MLKKNTIFSIIDGIIIAILLLLSIQKAGFYTEYMLLFQILFIGIYLVSFVCHVAKRIQEKLLNNQKEKKQEWFHFLLLLLPIAYTLPLVFGNVASKDSAVFEVIRYLDLYLIYRLVRRSKNKRIYEKGIILIAFIQALIALDGISCRFLNPFLKQMGSGYLSFDITRASGTIQYANMFGMLLMIALGFILIEWKKTIYQPNILLSSSHTLQERKKIISHIMVLQLLSFTFISMIVLTNSRVLIVLLLFMIMMFFCSKRKMKSVSEENFYIKEVDKEEENNWQKNKTSVFLFVMASIILSCFFVTIVSKVIYKNPFWIYILYSFSLMLLIAISSFIIKMGHDFMIKKERKIPKFIVYGCFLGILGYGILSFFVTAPLVVSKDTFGDNTSILRNIYGIVQNQLNHIEIKINLKEENTTFQIKILEVRQDLNSQLIKEFSNADLKEGVIETDIPVSQDAKYLLIEFLMPNGSYQVEELKLNQQKKAINYVLLPTDLMLRMVEAFHGSMSFTTRNMYATDAIKILMQNSKNSMIGVGGGGFQELYDRVKTYDYVSSEVHNSFLQIAVESGMIGASIIIGIIIVVLWRAKNTPMKGIFLVYILHLCVDLDFSYLLGILLFGILLGLLEWKEAKKVRCENLILKIIEVLLVFILCKQAWIISIKAYIARYMPVPKFEMENMNIASQSELVRKNEKRLSLVPYKTVYIKNTIIEELRLIQCIKRENSEAYTKNLIYQNAVKSLQGHLNQLLEYEPYDKYHVWYICDIYMANLEDLITVYFADNHLEGYRHYTLLVKKMLENLEEEISVSHIVKSTNQEKWEKYALQLQKIMKDKSKEETIFLTEQMQYFNNKNK